MGQRMKRQKGLSLFVVFFGLGMFVSIVSLWTVSTLFVDENLVARKGNSTLKIPTPKAVKGNNSILKIPTPVFVASLPKSGTTSTWKYFTCGLGKGLAAHQWANIYTHNKTVQVKLGNCFQKNWRKNQPMFQDCGDYMVWTDTGVLGPGNCFYPSIHALDAIYEFYPRATIMNVIRESQAWAASIMSFNNMGVRWSEICNTGGHEAGAGQYYFPRNATQESYAKFYDWHTERIRQFAKDHPSMTYIEVPMESNLTGSTLEDIVGINASCWIHSKTKKGRQAKRKPQ